MSCHVPYNRFFSRAANFANFAILQIIRENWLRKIIVVMWDTPTSGLIAISLFTHAWCQVSGCVCVSNHGVAEVLEKVEFVA